LARFSKKTITALLFALILVSVALRYPLLDHERFQTDSYFIHGLSQSIVDEGQAKWTITPMSYLGLYPFSYPSGVPFLISEISVMTGASVEVSILFLNVLLAVLFCFVLLCLGREFLVRPEYALLVVLFGLLGARFIDTTYWNASARGAGIVLMTMLVFVFFKASSSRKNSLYALGILTCVVCFATHRMSVLIVLYGLAFAIAALSYRIVSTGVNKRLRKTAVGVSMLLGAAAMFTTLGYVELLDFTFRSTYGEGGVFDFEPAILAMSLNAAVSYTHQIGFIIVPAVFGLVVLFRKPRLSYVNFFPIAVLLAFVPLVGSGLYISMLVAPFIAILGVYFISVQWISGKRRRVTTVLLALLVAGSFVLPVWSVDRWNTMFDQPGESIIVENEVFSDANYLDVTAPGVFALSSQENLLLKLSVNSRTYFLKSGIPEITSGDIDPGYVAERIRPSDADFPAILQRWYFYEDTYFVDGFILGLMLSGVRYVDVYSTTSEEIRDYANKHSHLLVVVDNRYPDSFSNQYSSYPSNFLVELEGALSVTSPQREIPSYLLYRSELCSMYAVQITR